MNTVTAQTKTFALAQEKGDPLADRTTTNLETANLARIWTILRFTYGLVPIVAGLDKFTNLLTNWENYLSPQVLAIIPISGHGFMTIVGCVEILAGLLVFARPRIGAFVVVAWLTAIALSLIVGGHYFDVAVRDLVMAIGAFTLASLSPRAERQSAGEAH